LQDRARAVSRGTANRTAGLRERLASRRSHRGTTGGSRDRPRWQPVCVGRPRRSHPPCDVRPAMKARVALAFAVVALTAATAGAEVRRVVVDAREDVLGGAYEKLKGTVELELDPTHPANTVIVDLDRAPRNARGRVDASADFMVLRPPARGSVALLEVSNRGGKAVLPYFNRGTWSPDPSSADDFGDRLLMRLNLTLIWIGWQFDVPRQSGLLRLRAPIARGADGPI